MQRLGQRHGLRGRLARIRLAYSHRESARLPHAGAGRRYVLIDAVAAARLLAETIKRCGRERVARCIRRSRNLGPRAHGRLSQRDIGMAFDLHDVYRATGIGRLSTARARDESADAHAVQYADAGTGGNAHALTDAAADGHAAAVLRSALGYALKRGFIVGFE